MTDIVIAILVLLFLTILFLVPNFKIVRANEVHIVERLGRFHKMLSEPGIHFIVPLIDRVIQVVPILETHKKFHFKINIDDEEITYHLEYRYKVSDVMLFVYAALDSLEAIEIHIKNKIEEHHAIDDTQLLYLQEVSLTFGIELLDIQSK
jgi:regulator of protease activity HflC (stomatin/prohibitin superfamily)